MKCPACGHLKSNVLDSRPVEDGSSIRRRRECLNCFKRFTTYEIIDSIQTIVVKKSGDKELFDRSKLLGGILKACQKRPVNAEEIVNAIESEIQNSLKSEIQSREIGELVMKHLRAVDEVAYVRFASVYREFKDVKTFLDELNRLKEPK
ncbi:MAG: transcriptional repressor NrdR [Clostridia bacterium]|nr:transcriptional repressor NrdR [Clostridia bacterium]